MPRAREEVAEQAQQLACLGTNVNFAPVVDVDKGIRDAADRFSRIGDRSISADPALVARTARLYCGILAKAGVQCTLKHFPGLGGVKVDTHVGEAVLSVLDAADVAPFQELTQSLDPRPWVMLSHAIVAPLDRDLRPLRGHHAEQAIGVGAAQWLDRSLRKAPPDEWASINSRPSPRQDTVRGRPPWRAPSRR